SKTDALRYSIDGTFSNAAGPIHNASLFGSTRGRFTRRIKESIAIYMPNSELTYTDFHDYTNISLTRFASGMVSGAINMVAAGVGAGATAEIGGIGGIVGSQIAGNVTNTVGGLINGVSQLGGVPINPKVEILFANTAQREFSFDFLLSPINEYESKVIEQIIRTLRFHAAPELRSTDFASFFWIPPSEFDITFYNRGTENTKIPRINTCVLKQIDVSYSPTGTYATFSNGYPVQVRIMLRFQETEVNSKLRISQGF